MSTRKRAAWWWSSLMRFVMRTLMRSAAFRRLRFRRDPALAVLLMSWSRCWQRRWIRPKSCLPIWPASVSENQVRKVRMPGSSATTRAWVSLLRRSGVEGYRQVILAVVQGQPAVLVTVGQLLGHAEVSQDGVVGAAAWLLPFSVCSTPAWGVCGCGSRPRRRVHPAVLLVPWPWPVPGWPSCSG